MTNPTNKSSSTVRRSISRNKIVNSNNQKRTVNNPSSRDFCKSTRSTRETVVIVKQEPSLCPKHSKVAHVVKQEAGSVITSSKVNTGTFDLNDSPCSDIVAGLDDDLEDDDDPEVTITVPADLIKYTESDVETLRLLVLGTYEGPTRLPRKSPVHVTLFDTPTLRSLVDEVVSTPEAGGSMFITTFPTEYVVADGVNHYLCMAASMDSSDLNQVKLLTSVDEVMEVAVPNRVGLSRLGLKHLHDSYDIDMEDDEKKYATTDVFDVHSNFKMVGEKFSKNIFIMPCSLFHSIKDFNNKTNVTELQKKHNVLNYMDKMFYHQTKSTPTLPRPSLLAVGCILLPIIDDHHYSVVAVMNLNVKDGSGTPNPSDRTKCILHFDSLQQDGKYRPNHVTWDLGVKVRDLLNVLFEEDGHFTHLNLPIHRPRCKLPFVSACYVIL